MSIQVEEGKFYRTRDGRKAGPMTRVADSAPYSPPWIWTNAPRGQPRFGLLPPDYLWRDDGTEAWMLHTESPHDLIAEWVDEYPVWRDMTPEWKGAILLAFHEGKTIEVQDFMDNTTHQPFWCPTDEPGRYGRLIYRIKPPEPERKSPMQGPRRVVLRIDMEMPDGLPDTVIVNDIEYTK